MPFSVIIPYYNKEDTIKPCLDSIRSAIKDSSFGIEVIISDDGSEKPISHELIESYKDINLKVVRHPNVGCAQSRLIGIKNAEFGDDSIVVHLDPDDTIDPDSFEEIARWKCSFPDVDILIGNLRMFDSGIGIPYYVVPYGKPYAMKVGAVYPADIKDIMERGHCAVYKFAKLGLWRKCLNKSDLRVNCNEDLFLSVLLYSVSKTVVYTDICHYNYEFGQPTSIMSNTEVGVEPRDSKLTYMLAGMMSCILR